MLTLTSLITLLASRAEVLIPTVVLGFFVGEFIARYFGVDGAMAMVDRISKRWMAKLDKAERGIATRLYRGMVAMLLFVVPALIIGLVINHYPPAANVLMVALFGRAFATSRLFKRWRSARANTLALELPERDFLFADSHAVLRYSVLTSAELFAVGVVGVAFWYFIGGVPVALGYLVLAEVAAMQTAPIFGWASNALFRLMHFIPHLITLALLTLAGLFIPRAKPFAVRKAKRFHGFIAYLLNISLGGKLPERTLGWEGAGTPKLLPEHLARWLLVRLVATVLLLFLLAAPLIVKLLNLI